MWGHEKFQFTPCSGHSLCGRLFWQTEHHEDVKGSINFYHGQIIAMSFTKEWIDEEYEQEPAWWPVRIRCSSNYHGQAIAACVCVRERLVWQREPVTNKDVKISGLELGKSQECVQEYFTHRAMTEQFPNITVPSTYHSQTLCIFCIPDRIKMWCKWVLWTNLGHETTCRLESVQILITTLTYQRRVWRSVLNKGHETTCRLVSVQIWITTLTHQRRV